MVTTRLVAGATGMRERLLAQVRARSARFDIQRNPAAILDPEGLAEVKALLETVPDLAADLEVAYEAGWMHWLRSLVLDPDEGRRDVTAALRLWAPVFPVRPDLIPDWVRAYVGGDASPALDEFQVAADYASTLLRDTQTGDRHALDGAVGLLRYALAATPAGHPGRATFLSKLGVALLVRYRRTGSSADLDAAVDAVQAAVEATPAGHPSRAAALSDLRLALQLRSEHMNSVADFDASVEVGRAAVDALPVGHPGRARELSDLGIALLGRFQRLGRVADLGAAVEVSRAAVDAAPAGPDGAACLSNLSTALSAQFERTGRPG